MPASDGGPHDYLIVARVRRPHGVRGEVLVSVETDRPSEVFREGRILYLADGAGEPTGESYTVERVRPTARGAILKLAEMSARDGSETLRGHMLLIRAAEAEPAAEDEVHYRDLIGMRARTGDREIGVVSDILDFPTGEMLVVRDRAGVEVLVPFVKQIVVAVDVDRRVLDLDLPEGMLDI